MRSVLLLFHHSRSCLYCWNVQFLQLPFFLFALFQSLWLNSGSKHWILRSLTLHVLLFVLSCTVQQHLIYLLFLPSPFPFSVEISPQSLSYLTAILFLPVLTQQSEGEWNNF